MANTAAKTMKNTAGKMWGRLWIGWEGTGQCPLPVRFSKLDIDAGELNIYDLKLADTAFGTFHFRGQMAPPKAKIEIGSSDDPGLVAILRHAIDFAAGEDMGRFFMIAETMEETNRHGMRTIKLTGGILKSIPPKLNIEGMTSDPHLDELSFEFETIEYMGIYDQEMNKIDRWDRGATPSGITGLL